MPPADPAVPVPADAPLGMSRFAVQHDTDDVVVTRWSIDPGTHTGMHVHGLDYVVVPLTTGLMTLTFPDGSTMENPLTPGVTYTRSAGVEHDVANHGAETFEFIEVELRRPRP